MTCKDCIHYDICHNNFKNIDLNEEMTDEHCCVYFKDKSRFVEFPCKAGETVYCLDDIVDNELCADCEHYYEGGMGYYPSCQKTRYGFRSAKCIEIIEIVADNDFVLKYYNEFGEKIFLTKEEAEAKLNELNGNE